MLAKLSYPLKNRLLLAGTLVLAVLSWNMAFRKTYEAVLLSRELEKRMEVKTDVSVNPQYLAQKEQLLRRLLDKYTLDSANWKDEFWLKASGIASLKGAGINYNPAVYKPLSDSSSGVSVQEMAFESNFTKLVSVLDSLERTKDLGFIGSTKFRLNGKAAEREKLSMTISCRIVEEK